MLWSNSFLVASAWSSSIVGTLSSPTQVTQSPEPQSTACGDVIDRVNEGFAYLYASDAYACLTSVPFNSAVATRFIEYANTTIQFQSTLGYLKSPPAGYQQPAVDVLAQLEKIKINATTGVYQNQYQFELDVQHLLYTTHDTHLALTAGISAAFSFVAPFSITAASPDGKALPQVYFTDDIVRARNESWTPSPIKTINNQDAVEYLKGIASLNSFGGIEAHADWNQLFHTPALDIKGDWSIWDGFISFYPGDQINVTVANGTKYTDNWLAIYTEPYETGPLTTGGDFYNYFVLGLLPASFNASAGLYNAAYSFDSDPDTAPVVATNSWKDVSNGAFPDPDVAQDGLTIIKDGVVSGYFLRDIDAAVLSLPTFRQRGYAIGNFSLAVSNFIGNVTEAKLSRVVIDLQQNTGGTVELAFDTFKRFFPDHVPFSGSRRRSHPLGNTLGEAYTAYFDGLQPEDPRYNNYLASMWVITPRLNAATGQNFSSWAEYAGPVLENNDSFSLTERFNLSSYEFNAALFEGWNPWGYTPENPVGAYQQPFAVEDIVVFTDGACSSTCALLVEMFTEVGVKTIVAGGLPITGPMQAVGGNRGSATFSADTLDQYLKFLPSNERNNTFLDSVPRLNQDGYRDSGMYTKFLGVNLRDQVRPNDTIPLQFKYEAADCRIFYTLDNVYNMSRLWRDVVSASFDDPSLCVANSTGFRDSSKPAPVPSSIKPVALDLNFTNRDILPVLTGPGLDLSGGPKDGDPIRSSGRVTICDNQYCVGGECIQVEVKDCETRSTQELNLCVPVTGNADDCPANTQLKITSKHTLKSVFVSVWQDSHFQYIGPCMPDSDEFCI